MTDIIYIRMKHKIQVKEHSMILLRDIAQISTQVKEKDFIYDTPLYEVKVTDNKIVMIDSFMVIEHLNKQFKTYEFELIGANETIVEIEQSAKKRHIGLVAFIWVLLFIGTAMTIINFHYDVSMQEVQQQIHYIFSGEKEEFPLFIQIPYSLGLGIGMVVFLNRWFKKKINEEPSPLEIELFNYQKDLDSYISYYENPLNNEDDTK